VTQLLVRFRSNHQRQYGHMGSILATCQNLTGSGVTAAYSIRTPGQQTLGKKFIPCLIHISEGLRAVARAGFTRKRTVS
jgi:hypothetical protein